jgi:hypothetical protein
MKKKKMTLTVEAHGKTKDDLVMALEEVIKALNSGCHSGFDRNEDGDYTFDTVKP